MVELVDKAAESWRGVFVLCRWGQGYKDEETWRGYLGDRLIDLAKLPVGYKNTLKQRMTLDFWFCCFLTFPSLRSQPCTVTPDFKM